MVAIAARLVDAGMLIQPLGDVRLAFRHALVHEAVAREGLAAQRQQRHRQVLDAAEAMAAEGSTAMSVAESAAHALAAGDRSRALSFSQEAARHAEEIGAQQEAVAHLERALSLVAPEDDPALRPRLQLSCGRLRARIAIGDARAEALLADARDAYAQLGDRMRAAWARALLAGIDWERGRPLALAEWQEAVGDLRAARAHEPLRTALAGLAAAAARERHLDFGLQAAEEGLSLVPVARNGAEARDRAELLRTVGLVRLLRSDDAGGRAALEEAVRLATEHHDDLGAARAHYRLATSNVLLVTAAEAEERLAIAAQLAERHGLRRMQAFYVACRTWGSSRAGQWQTTRALIHEVGEIADPDEQTHVTHWILASARADVLLADADLAGAEAAKLALLDHELVSAGDRWTDVPVQEAALVRLLSGDPGGAREMLGPVLPRYLAQVERGEAEVEVFPPVVQVLAAAGDLEPARRLAEWGSGLLPDHPQIRYCHALLDMTHSPARAAGSVESAAAATEADGWVFLAATDRIAAMIIAAGHPEGRSAAVALARAARERFSGLGCDGWVRRADEHLRRLGARAPTPTAPGAGGVTARELEVLRLVADGLTNRQIAERLVISEHTAVRHVANVFRKLGARNRSMAVRAAVDQRLVPPATTAASSE